MNQKFKRKFKKIFPEKEQNLVDSCLGFFVKLTVVAFLLFISSNIFVNFLLTPKGIQLEDLSQEKNILLENNRELGQEIARIKSINIIKEITGESMNLASRNSEKIIYISNDSIIAGL